MTRIDMTASAWRQLIAPVLPHTLASPDFPELGLIRIEAGPTSVTAVATDRTTLAAERRPLRAADHIDDPRVIAIRAAEAKASLSLFPHTKDDDPTLRITVDTVAVPVRAAGHLAEVPRLALTIVGPDARVVLSDHLDPSRDPLSGWRATMGRAMARPLAAPPPTWSLNATHLPKWAKAVRHDERLAVFAGPKDGDPLLILVEDHFAGIWPQVSWLDPPERMLATSPWRGELGGALDA